MIWSVYSVFDIGTPGALGRRGLSPYHRPIYNGAEMASTGVDGDLFGVIGCE